MKLGYARVSTPDQSLDPQTDALRQEGCEKLFTDVVTGTKDERRGLSTLLKDARKGDVIVVAKLDRLGRSLRHLIDVMGELNGRGIGLKSLSEGIDTTTSGGRLVFHIFGAIAEFERALIIERTEAGLSSARARGRVGGRPRKLGDAKVKTLLTMSKDLSLSVSDICRSLGIGKDTYYRYLNEAKAKKGGKPQRSKEKEVPATKAPPPKSKETTPPPSHEERGEVKAALPKPKGERMTREEKLRLEQEQARREIVMKSLRESWEFWLPEKPFPEDDAEVVFGRFMDGKLPDMERVGSGRRMPLSAVRSWMSTASEELRKMQPRDKGS